MNLKPIGIDSSVDFHRQSTNICHLYDFVKFLKIFELLQRIRGHRRGSKWAFGGNGQF